MNKKKHESLLLYSGVALITMAMALCCMAGAELWPFGRAVFTYLDNSQSVAPFIASLKLIYSGVEDIDWAFLSGGADRTALLAHFHILLFPSFWLASLLPADSALQTLSWLFIIQLIWCSLTRALRQIRWVILCNRGKEK